MPSLIAKSPLAGQAPLTHGMVTLSEAVLDRVTSVAPFNGQDKALAKALKALGLAFPEPNRFVEKGGARIVWTGRDQAFLIGADPAGLDGVAALTDQSDGWACLRVEGAGAVETLVRHYPLDLRLLAFPVGRAARAPLNHMSSVLMRTGVEAFEILVFRSMARTAWDEIAHAMKLLAARSARPV